MTLNNFILILIFAIIIFATITSFSRIKLFLLKTFYSKYNYRYINAYKKYTNKNPHGYCIKDEFVFHILEFFKKNESCESYTTDKVIKLSDVEYFTTYKELTKIKEKPICFNSYFLNNKYDVKIIGYRDSMFNSSMRVLFYFIDDVFFMGEYVIKETSDNKIERISKIIHEKYLGRNNRVGAKENFYIDGLDNSKMYFTNTGFSLIIKYFSNNDNTIKAKIDNICGEYKGIIKNFEKQKQTDELYEKL